MNENQLAPCWEFQPYLAENYVRHLLAEIANVLEQLYYHKHALDSIFYTLRLNDYSASPYVFSSSGTGNT